MNMPQPSQERDLYKRLNVSPDAPTLEVVAAFRKIVPSFHPNTILRFNESRPYLVRTEDYQREYDALNEAFFTLVDPLRRTLYDRKRNSELGFAEHPPELPYAEQLEVYIKNGKFELAFNLAGSQRNEEDLARVLSAMEPGIGYTRGDDSIKKFRSAREKIVREAKTFDQMLGILEFLINNPSGSIPHKP